MTDNRILMYILRYYGGLKIKARTENDLIKQISSFDDKEKRRIRFFFTCLFMNKIVKQNYKIIKAYTTEREQHANRIRNKIRSRFVREGKVKRGDGTHIHHKNGNVFDNRNSNLLIVDATKHKHAHRHHKADANCKKALHAILTNLNETRHRANHEQVVRILKRRLKRALST